MNSFLKKAGQIAGAALVAQICLPAPPAQAYSRVFVPCDTASLIAAINTVNMAGQGSLELAAFCNYVLTTAASTGTRGPNGLPIINANVTITGRGARITRSPMASAFRIMEIAISRTVTITNLTIRGGDAGPNPGGGILNARGLLTLTAGNIEENTADSGAGIANDTGRVSLTDSAIEGNDTAGGGGGGGIYNDGELTTLRTRIRFNRANTSGGGVFNELGGVATFRNTIINGNTAEDRGGGMFNGGGGVANLFSTIINGNTAGNTGGGVFNAFYTGAVRLNNSLITANTPNNCAPPGSVAGCAN